MITPFAINVFLFKCNFGQYNGIRLRVEFLLKSESGFLRDAKLT